eukprot:364388-Chlamydomonas_euryale.AAC.20
MIRASSQTTAVRFFLQGTYAELVAQGLDISQLVHIEEGRGEAVPATDEALRAVLGDAADDAASGTAAAAGSRKSVEFADDTLLSKAITLRRVQVCGGGLSREGYGGKGVGCAERAESSSCPH